MHRSHDELGFSCGMALSYSSVHNKRRSIESHDANGHAFVSLETKVSCGLFLTDRSWTLVYDTEYACQDRKDDVKAGVKSAALLFGAHVRTFLMFFAAIFVGTLIIGGILNEQTAPY